MDDRWKVLVAVSLKDAGWSMVFIYVAFETYERGSLLGYALIRGLPALSYFLGTRIYGSLSDQMGARKPLLLTAAVLSPLFIVALAFTPLELWLPITIIWYLMTSDEPVVIAFLADRGSGGAAAGDLFSVAEVGYTAGTLAGGLLTEIFGLRTTLLVAAAVASLSVPIIYSVSEGAPIGRPDLTIAFKMALSLKWPGRTGLIVPSLLLAGSAISTFYVAFSLKVFEASGRSEAIMGLLIAGAGVAGAIVSPLYGRLVDRVGPRKAFMASCLLYAVYFSIGALLQGFLLLAILLVLPLFALYYSARNALAISLASEDERASASSVTAAVGAVSEALGNGIGGVTMSLAGLGPTMWLGAAMSALAAPALYVAWREGLRERR